MFRARLTAIFAWLLLSLGAAAAANLPLISGPIDPSNQIANLNTVVQAVNAGVTGNLTAAGNIVTSGTSAFNLLTATIPGGALLPGQVIHIRISGVNSADANAKTLTFNFGASSLTLTVTASAATWWADCAINITATGASPTETAECHGAEGTTLLASTQATNWTVSTASAVTVSVQGTAATSGTMTLVTGVIEVDR